MSIFQKLLLILTMTLLGTMSFAGSLNVINPNFSTPTIACATGYAYQGAGGCSGAGVPEQDFNSASGFGWLFGSSGNSGNGLTAASTAFNPPSFTGLPFTQAAFLQGTNNAVSQTIGGFAVNGTYSLDFYLGSRYASGAYDGNQTVEALLDGNVIGTWALSSSTPFTLESVDFTVSSGGNHTLEFIGTNSGDHTAFLSDVAVTPVPEPSSLMLLGSGLLGFAAYVRRRLI
jgi:hypothetical protein